MWRDEWEFWTSEPDLGRLQAEEDLKQLMLMQAHKNLPPIQSQLDLIDRETEIVPGIQAIEAPGHTPGHMVLAISSGNEKLMYISDALVYPIHVEQPEWYPAVDLEPEEALVTRYRLLDQVATETSLVIACHFPFPGLGHVIQKGSAWEWQPIET
jgi:glyoxylase-like metal-dependent hydrolase (beta-lactamase superfamily II)